MSLLTIAAMAGFASVVYMIAVSLVEKALDRSVAVRRYVFLFLAIAACGLVVLLAFSKSDVVLGFVIGGVLTPIVHRAMKKQGGWRFT
jgi:hypothetical protein